MKTAQSIGSEDLKKNIAIGAGVLLALGFLFYELSGTGIFPWESSAAPPAATAAAAPTTPAAAPNSGNAPAGTPAKAVGTTAANLDPTLHMDAMLVTESVSYSGSGRNIFSMNSAPVELAIPKPIASVRPNQAAAPTPIVVVGPPPVPPIDLKFFGTATQPDGSRQGFFLHGDDVFLAAAGEIVLRRYRVVSISANSAQVEDLPNNNTQMLPLQPN